jgi:hypothetical protein
MLLLLSFLFQVLAAFSHHISQTAGQFLHVINMKELVRPVSVRVWPQHSSDEELPARPQLLQKTHQWNGAAFAHANHLVSKEQLRSIPNRIIEIRLVLVWTPACWSPEVNDFSFGVIRDILK